MKLTSIVLSILLIASFSARSQTPPFAYRPSFAAVVVKDITKSGDWYQSVFGLRVKERMGDEKTDYKVTILESQTFVLELLQLKGSIDAKAMKKGKPENTEVEGLFKVGFHVANMDECLQALAKLKVNVPRVYTDDKTKKRNFLITDPDGNLIQFFE